MPNLSGKTALVTGASRGIGRASALALAAAGAQVLVHYGRGATEADGIVAEIRKAGGRGDAVAADLAAADGPPNLRDSLALSSAIASIFLSQVRGSRSQPRSKIPPLRTSIGFSPSMSALPSFSSSNCFRSYRKEAVSFLSRRSRHAALSGRSQPMQQPRALLTLWRSILPRCLAPVGSASMRWRPAWSRPICRTSPKRTPAAISRWACRLSSVWRSLTISVASSPSWHRKMPGGSAAIQST